MIPCNACRQCNIKGKPSVSRGSKYCNDHIINVKRKTFFGSLINFKDKLLQKRTDEKGNLKTSKGFRRSWWYN